MNLSIKYSRNKSLLFLIFQPPVSITSPKAVMVFFHGGGFVRGTALPQSYPADYLINYDIILVTVAYRLHALGSLPS